MSGTECSLFANGWCFTALVFGPGAPESAAALPWSPVGAGQPQEVCYTRQCCCSWHVFSPAGTCFPPFPVPGFLDVPGEQGSSPTLAVSSTGQQCVVLTGWHQKGLGTRLLTALWSSASCHPQVWKSPLSKNSPSSIWSKFRGG